MKFTKVILSAFLFAGCGNPSLEGVDPTESGSGDGIEKDKITIGINVVRNLMVWV